MFEKPRMDPEEALESMTVPIGFDVTVFASEPDVHQPIALATDDRGRLWVAENYTYSEKSTNYSDQLSDRVVILEDVDGDGKFDERKVFWDQGRRLTSVEVGHGGVWVLDAPNLLFIPDANEDDIPDSDPVVMLDGWDDFKARHTIVNGLRWGPDGWLYGRHGIIAISNVGVPGSTPNQRQQMDCGIWRFHPTKHQFEIVCVGTTNPWGMDWDEHGQMFFINTVIGHLWHVIPGARYRRMFGEHLLPNTYGVIHQTADHVHWDSNEAWDYIRKDGGTTMSDPTDNAGGGHAHCGMMILQGQPYPEELQGSVLALNLHGRRVNRDTLHRHGATYTARHAADFLKVEDPWFRGIEIISGRNGEIFIADWSDTGECHDNDGIHRTSGRIYRLAVSSDTDSLTDPAKLPPGIPTVNQLSTEQLVDFVASPWEWLSRKCLLELSERAAQNKVSSKTHQDLLARFHSDESVKQRLRRLWALQVTGGVDQAFLTQCLDNPSEHIRCWAIRFLSEQDSLSPLVLSKFQSLAQQDESGLVLTWLASSLQRLRYEDRWSIASALSRHQEYAEDRVLPLMIWYGVEPAILSNPQQAIAMAVSCHMPLLREYIARRMTLEIERQPEMVSQFLEQLTTQTNDSSVIADALRGMTEALRGWRKATPVTGWQSFSAAQSESNSEEVRRLTRELALVFGDGRALEELRAIAINDACSIPERRSAIQTLVNAGDKNILPHLQNLVGARHPSRRTLREDAIRGLAAFSDIETARLLLAEFNGFDVRAREAAITTLVSRPQFANILLDAITAGSIDRSNISAFQLRQMQNSGDPRLAARVSELWPQLSQQSAEKAETIAELRAMLTPKALEQADPSNGRVLFTKSCATCHALYGEGNKIAPDLTGSQRSNLNYLLENIVDPSATVSKSFQLLVVLLDDGRVINGVAVENAEKTLTIQTATEQIVISRDEIEQMNESPLSMMPENLLKVLDDQQIRDLIAYLMTTAQVPLPN